MQVIQKIIIIKPLRLSNISYLTMLKHIGLCLLLVVVLGQVVKDKQVVYSFSKGELAYEGY